MISSLRPQSLGKYAEDIAVRALKKEGHEIIARNFRTKSGEIDVISLKDDIIYVNEVKKRDYFAENAIKESQIERLWFVFEEFLDLYQEYEAYDATMQLILISNNSVTFMDIQ